MRRKEPRRLPSRSPAGLWGRLGRSLRFRLIIPILRSRHSPQHTARGVMVGLIVACLPVPIGQMAIAFSVWVVARRLFSWHFSVIQGVGWTLVTNIFTSPPCFYVFFLTGQILLGRWDDLSGYRSFVQTFTAAVASETGLLDTLQALGKAIALEWVLAMWVGAVPWAVLFGWFGYRLALRFAIAYRVERARRMERRLARYGRTIP